MVRDEDMLEAFRACMRHKASSPSAVKYFPDYQRDILRLVDEVNARTYRHAVEDWEDENDEHYRRMRDSRGRFI